LIKLKSINDKATKLENVRPQFDSDATEYINTPARLEIGKFSLYYERTTPPFQAIADERLPGAGLPIVFLHGMRGNHLSWWQQVPYFTALGYECISLDQRGFGLSSDPDDLFCKAHPTDLARLLDNLKIDRVVLVGQSMGGWTIVGCALDRPDRIAGLVLCGSPGGIVSAAMDERIRVAAKPASTPSDSIRQPNPQDGLPQRREMDFLYDQISTLGAQPPTDAGTRLRAMNYDLDLARSQLTMPVLCIVGQMDDVFPPDVITELTTILPDARLLTVADGGHSVYFETATVFNQLVRDFLIDIGYRG
jgi:3-oxoadipate enol-lactonase